jgi:hypothetical protein
MASALVMALLATNSRSGCSSCSFVFACLFIDVWFFGSWQMLVTKREASSPLYLAMACEEIRLWGNFELFPQLLHELPSALQGLFEYILHRLEKDLGRFGWQMGVEIWLSTQSTFWLFVLQLGGGAHVAAAVVRTCRADRPGVVGIVG